MAKNVEWGAVAYLAHSSYGINGIEIGKNVDSGYKTGKGASGSAYNTLSSKNASTTNNVYGIYDMRGGSREYVAGCLEGKENILLQGKLNNETNKNKYIDIYKTTDYGANISKYGDAIYETSNGTSNMNSWFKDYSFFITSSECIFERGGDKGHGTDSGIFYFSRKNGSTDARFSFRPVCIVY